MQMSRQQLASQGPPTTIGSDHLLWDLGAADANTEIKSWVIIIIIIFVLFPQAKSTSWRKWGTSQNASIITCHYAKKCQVSLSAQWVPNEAMVIITIYLFIYCRLEVHIKTPIQMQKNRYCPWAIWTFKYHMTVPWATLDPISPTRWQSNRPSYPAKRHTTSERSPLIGMSRRTSINIAW